MCFRILPSITEICFIGIDNAESSLVKQPQHLWRFTVMLVHFWTTTWKTVQRVEDRMIEREFLKILL